MSVNKVSAVVVGGSFIGSPLIVIVVIGAFSNREGTARV